MLKQNMQAPFGLLVVDLVDSNVKAADDQHVIWKYVEEGGPSFTDLDLDQSCRLKSLTVYKIAG